MTSRARVLVLVLVLSLLAVVLARQWMLRAASPEAIEARFNQMEEGESGLYRLEIGATQLGLTGGSFTALEVMLRPDSAELERRREAGTPVRTQYAITIPRIEVTGINRRALLRGDYDLLDVVAHGLDIQVRVDRQIVNREAPDTIRLPHERLQASVRDIFVGRASVVDGRVRYFERSRDGARFALLEFDSVQASAAAITNRATGGLEGGLVPIELAGLMGGKSRITSSLVYNTRTPGFNLVMNGGLGPTDGALLNSLLTDLEGVRIAEGVVDSIAWEIEVEEGVAKGRMMARYRDLTMEQLDKVTRTQSLGDEIVSFFGNNFKISRSNPAEGEPVRVVPLAHRRAADEAFFRFLWVTLRGGLLATVGL
jgi:hypothetical protein